MTHTTNFTDELIGYTDLSKVNGGSGSSAPNTNRDRTFRNGCPDHGGREHVYVKTDKTRPSDNYWFYDTERLYLCSCGHGYWYAGIFTTNKFEYVDIH